MSTIVTRSGKGSPLTHSEMDSNLTNLNTDKYQSGDPITVSSISDTGNLAFTGTGNRITGAMSSNTRADNVLVQSTGASSTRFGLMPPSAGTQTQFELFNSTTPTDSIGQVLFNTSEFSLRSAIVGTGTTYLPMTFYTGGSERMRIDTSGNVVIGNTSAVGKFGVYGSAPEVNIMDSGANGTRLWMKAANTEVQIGTNYASSNVPIKFVGGGGTTTFMTIDASGNVGIGGTPSAKLDVQGGALGRAYLFYNGTSTNYTDCDTQIWRNAAGVEAMNLGATGVLSLTKGQLKFPATQVPSADANTLDDYEEGTWTPSVSFSVSNGDLSYSLQYGFYTKIGRVVNYTCFVRFSETTANGVVTVTGLPFVSANLTGLYGVAPLYCDGVIGVSGSLSAYIGPNTSVANVFYNGTGAITSLSNSNTTNTPTTFIFTGSYFV